MNIIFDYNRTLFDPETDSLYQGVPALLKKLSTKNTLFLVSKNELGREEKFEKLRIKNYFQKVVFVEKKTKELFESLSQTPTDTVVVGDRAKGEILLGRELGFITVWIRQGKFSDELPEKPGYPDFTISDIRELSNIISRYEK